MPRIYLHIGITLLFLIILLVIVATIRKWFSGSDSQAAENREKELQQIGVSPSYPDFQYNQWADQIQTALARYSDIQDDEDAAMQILSEEMNNEMDVVRLIQAYGTREDRVFGWNDGNKSLPQLIRNEFDAADIEKLNGIYRSKGIQYQF